MIAKILRLEVLIANRKNVAAIGEVPRCMLFDGEITNFALRCKRYDLVDKIYPQGCSQMPTRCLSSTAKSSRSRQLGTPPDDNAPSMFTRDISLMMMPIRRPQPVKNISFRRVVMTVPRNPDKSLREAFAFVRFSPL